MLDHVRRTHSPGDVYLVPPMDPAFIGFRLDTGAPVLATWKSHPYRMDDELREWRERIEAGRAIYGASGDSICASADRAAARYGVTHVVTRVGAQDPVCASWTETFRDTAFAVYRVR